MAVNTSAHMATQRFLDAIHALFVKKVFELIHEFFLLLGWQLGGDALYRVHDLLMHFGQLPIIIGRLEALSNILGIGLTGGQGHGG